MNINNPHYRIGSIITYSTFGGTLRRIVVDEIDADIKNGEPGFGGLTIPGNESVWGYDDQIVTVSKY